VRLTVAQPPPRPAAVVAQLEAPVVWLDGPGDRALIAWAPREVVTRGDWVAAGRALHRPGAGGGVLGFVGYGAGHHAEAVPREAPVPEGECWLGRFDGLLRYDGRRWAATGSSTFQARARAALHAASDAGALRPPPPPPRRPLSTVDRSDWMEGVEQILAWLRAGDAYQVNLTRPVWVEGVDDAFACYRRLRRRSPAAHGAWLDLGEAQVLSNSPELLLEVEGAQLVSEPIKGTRPRSTDPREDEALGRALLAASKDSAELTMIVDLVRNDLGRVAVPGSVVPGPRQLTSHATVHHTSRRVTATLRPDLDRWDALAACFPPGSVTGAPKVRATQRIAQLEAHPRGVYCGTIGAFLDDGGGAWSVAIRTGVVHGGRARFHVGGGIVVDSDPADEWEETEHKAAALRAAFSAL